MLTERNPYDPIEVKLPSFTYWLKAGVAFSIGAAIVAYAGLLLWSLIGWRIAFLTAIRGLG